MSGEDDGMIEPLQSTHSERESNRNECRIYKMKEEAWEVNRVMEDKCEVATVWSGSVPTETLIIFNQLTFGRMMRL